MYKLGTFEKVLGVHIHSMCLVLSLVPSLVRRGLNLNSKDPKPPGPKPEGLLL